MVGFTLEDDPTIQLAAWTTTPWTLPSNLSLVVHPDLDYVLIEDSASGKKYILLEEVVGLTSVFYSTFESYFVKYY